MALVLDLLKHFIVENICEKQKTTIPFLMKELDISGHVGLFVFSSQKEKYER